MLILSALPAIESNNNIINSGSGDGTLSQNIVGIILGTIIVLFFLYWNNHSK